MKKTVSLGLILLCLIVAIGFAGCTGSDPVVGTWENNQLNVKWVFNADQTITVSAMGATASGKWANQGNGKYAISPTSGGNIGQDHTCQISKDGKTLTTVYGNAKVVCTKVS